MASSGQPAARRAATVEVSPERSFSQRAAWRLAATEPEEAGDVEAPEDFSTAALAASGVEAREVEDTEGAGGLGRVKKSRALAARERARRRNRGFMEKEERPRKVRARAEGGSRNQGGSGTFGRD